MIMYTLWCFSLAKKVENWPQSLKKAGEQNINVKTHNIGLGRLGKRLIWYMPWIGSVFLCVHGMARDGDCLIFNVDFTMTV